MKEFYLFSKMLIIHTGLGLFSLFFFFLSFCCVQVIRVPAVLAGLQVPCSVGVPRSGSPGSRSHSGKTPSPSGGCIQLVTRAVAIAFYTVYCVVFSYLSP